MRNPAICLCLLTAVNCVAMMQERAAARAQQRAPAVAAPAPAPKTGAPALLKDPAIEAFRRGARIVDRDCAECMDASVKGLSEGIDSLKKAIELGYADPAAVHRRLRDAYANMRAFFERSDPERKRYQALRDAEVAEIVTVDPSDLDNRLEYILTSASRPRETRRRRCGSSPPNVRTTLGDSTPLSRLLFATGANDEALPHAERWLANAKGAEVHHEVLTLLESVPVAELRRILVSAPKFHPAQYQLSMRLLHHGSTAEGLRLARRALEQAPPAMTVVYVESPGAPTENEPARISQRNPMCGNHIVATLVRTAGRESRSLVLRSYDDVHECCSE